MTGTKNNRKVRSRSLLPKALQDLLILQFFMVGRIFIRVMASLGENRARFLTRVAYWPFSRFNRRVCRRNLDAYFLPLNRRPAELEQLYKGYLEYMVRFQEETGRCFFIAPGELEKKVWLQGEAQLRETLMKGRGALIVSGHMGTWWHVPCLLANRGYKVNVVFNSFPYPRIEDYLRRHAARYGIKLTFVDKGIPQMVRRAAENNEVVYLTFDVSVRRHHGNWLPFGATRININPGPAILALRHRMPALYATTFHGDARRSHVVIHPEFVPEPGNGEALSSQLCRSWVDQLHSEVSRHPEQWWGWGFSDLPCVRKRAKASNPVPVTQTAPASPKAVTTA